MKMNSFNVEQNENFRAVSLLDNKAWVFEQMNQINTAEKIVGTFEFKGSLNVEAVEKSLLKIYSSNEYFEQSEDLLIDVNEINRFFSFEYVDFEYDNNLPDSLVKIFTNEIDYDFTSAFLFKAILLKVENRKFLLTIDVHQKINEGLTPLILLKEIMYLYTLYTKDDEYKEPVVAIQYR